MTQVGWLAVTFLLLSACGSKETVGDPEVSRRLADCQSALKRAETATEMCSAQSATTGEWVLHIEGDTVKIGARSYRSASRPPNP